MREGVAMAFVAQFCLIVMLIRFEQVDVLQQLEREVKTLAKQNEAVEGQSVRMREFWSNCQQLTELWLYRTLPRRGPAGQHSGRERPVADPGEEPWAPRGLAKGRWPQHRFEEGVREEDQPAVSGARVPDPAEQPRGNHCEQHGCPQGHCAGQVGAAHRDAALSRRLVRELPAACGISWRIRLEKK